MKQNRIWVMEQLHDGRIFSIDDLCRELGKTDRTVRRILKELRKAETPIEAYTQDDKKYFYIREEKRRPKINHTLRFDEEEILALWVAVQAARSALAPTPLLMPLNAAFDSLQTVLSKQKISFHIHEQSRHWHFGVAPSVELDSRVFNLLRQAIMERLSVRFDYNTASSGVQSMGRKVDPYSFALRGTTWLLIAFCHTKEKILDFAVTDITNVRLCDPEEEEADFEMQKDFDLDLHFRDRFNALASGEIYEVRLLVEPNRAPYFRRKLYHPTQQIEETREDGRIIVSYEVAGLEEIRSFIQSWGTGITVLEPEELVERIKNEIEELAHKYQINIP